MSIILKGIDMPEKENQMYMMELYADGHCSVAKIEDGKCYELTIPSETEAIQIPKGHGDIKDVEELKSIKSIQSADFNSIETIQKWIDDAPTILEAESEENDETDNK